MAYRWMKLYYEILDDPKMALLPDFLYRRTIELFLLAGRNGDDGVLQPVAHMAWSLKVDEKRLVENLRSLEQIGVVAETEPGKWIVVNYAKRQSAEDNTERVKAFRSRKEQKKPLETDEKRARNDDVTKRYTEENKNKTLTTTTTSAPPPKKSNVFEFYSANIGALTAFTAETLKDLEQTYSEEWTLAALSEAVASEARNLKYAEAILRRWKTDGFQSRKARTDQPARGNGGGKKQTPAQAQVELTEWLKEKEAQGVNIN